MCNSKPQTYGDIDWVTLRENARAKKGWTSKSSSDWDKKAQSFSKRTKDSRYIDLFLAELPLTPSMSVLDIGSGPGTLALPMAPLVKSVTALDYSQGMLDTLATLSQEQQIKNIRPVQCAWEDDWHQKGIEPHDIAIASRSMSVKDLRAALEKINSYGTKYVFISDRIGPTPFEPAAFKALGRSTATGPDYIYTLNILYTMDVHPNVTVLELERDATYSSMDEAINSFSWMFHGITVEEEKILKKYIDSRIIHSDHNGITVRRDSPPRWALIWWKK